MPTILTQMRRLPGSAGASRISVVHLVLSVNIGGLEKVVYDLARFADRERLATRVLCLDEIGGLGPAFEEIGVPVECLGVQGKGVLRGIRVLARRLRELRPDVLHTHNAAAHIVGAPAACWSGVPAVVNTRHGLHQFPGWRAKLANRLATRLSHRIVSVSASAAELSRVADRCPHRKQAIIRNGVDLELYQPRERSNGSPVCRAIHAARLAYPTKDQRTLLRAVRLVADQVPDFTLDLVGDGPDRPALEALCDELRLRAHVRFLGYRHDVHELLAQADLFLLSSVTEGLPMTILEAMAAGLPVVATDVGGLSEVVLDGQTGFLVPAQSPSALAAPIIELVRDPRRARDMGAAGRRRVENEFDIRVVVAKYEELYRQVLNS